MIVSTCGALLLGVPALILSSRGGSTAYFNESNLNALFAVTSLVVFLAVFFLTVCAVQLWNSMRRYEIGEEVILSYEPLRKTREIALKDIADLYIVVHTSMPGRYHHLGTVIRDIYDKDKVIYYVILLRAGCPARLLVDDMSYWMRRSAKDYILYDFVYDRESVSQIMRSTDAILHTDETMYYYLCHDATFEPYHDRMQCEELHRLYGDLPFEK